MKSSLITGGCPDDYIDLIPETVTEAADLVRIALSDFGNPDRVFLDLSKYQPSAPMTLRIYVKPRHKPVPLDAATRDAIDSTP